MAWFGDRGSLEQALAEGCPGLSLQVHDAGRPWPELVRAALSADADTAIAWTGVHELARELRVRLAMARADVGALLVVLRPTVATPGLWGVEPPPRRPREPEDRLAALLAAEPSALERARALVGDGTLDEGALVARLEAAEDPGAASALAAYEAGAIEVEAVVQARVSADVLRALWGRPEVAARRADIAEQLGWAITHTLPRRRFFVAPMGRPIEPPDASLWLPSLAGAAEWARNPRWPLIFRHPRLLVGLVRAAERSDRGTLWWRLADKAPELPFPAPALGWARRYAAVDPDGGEPLLGLRYQQAVSHAAMRDDFDRIAGLTAAWQADLPAGWGGVKARLLAAICGDDERVVALRPEVEGARSHAVEAELFRLRGLVLRRAGYLAEAEVDLRTALALELQWGRARDLAPWSSLILPHDAGRETAVGSAATRVALAALLVPPTWPPVTRRWRGGSGPRWRCCCGASATCAALGRRPASPGPPAWWAPPCTGGWPSAWPSRISSIARPARPSSTRWSASWTACLGGCPSGGPGSPGSSPRGTTSREPLGPCKRPSQALGFDHGLVWGARWLRLDRAGLLSGHGRGPPSVTCVRLRPADPQARSAPAPCVDLRSDSVGCRPRHARNTCACLVSLEVG
ncbi:MAG: hypothetical protein CSA66_06390 [Proteobacteria bacterium]|nr:MAG: hypothetical protein CSA66_06390 [Pseudomonadota bacterium]